MKTIAQKLLSFTALGISAAALSLAVGLGTPSTAQADEADAKKLFKAMSNYVAGQKAISFDYDAILEVVTKDNQKLALASSGSVILNRPGKVRASRAGGFADVEMLFDGKKMTLFGKTANLYTQINVSGTIDNLVDELRNKYNRPLPAADLIMANVYDQLMTDVIDVKDLGSAMIGGVECDYFAFRKKAIDFQIWIAQGNSPHPCRYVITSKDMDHQPQYSIQIRNWITGGKVAKDDFSFKNTTKAKEVDVKDLKGMSAIPEHFKRGKDK